MASTEFLQPLARELPRGVEWLRSLPWPAAAALLALGLLGLLLGARSRRAVAGVGGFAAGAIAGLTLAAPALRSLSPALGPATSALICGVAVAVLSAVVPWVFPFTLGAVSSAVEEAIGARRAMETPA